MRAAPLRMLVVSEKPDRSSTLNRAKASSPQQKHPERSRSILSAVEGCAPRQRSLPHPTRFFDFAARPNLAHIPRPVRAATLRMLFVLV